MIEKMFGVHLLCTSAKGGRTAGDRYLGIVWNLRGRGKHEDGTSGVAMTAKVLNVPTFEGAGLDYPI